MLEELAANPTLTQRHLARELRVALGLTNLMIRRLITKGYVEAVNRQKNRLHYLITPKGLAEKTRLTYEYLEYSLYLYRRVREVLTDSLRRIAPAADARIVLFGTGEVAEIAFLTLKELNLQLVAVIDDRAAGTHFLGLPIKPIGAVFDLPFDCGIVTSLLQDSESWQRRLEALGVPPQKLIAIERNRTDIRAVWSDTRPND